MWLQQKVMDKTVNIRKVPRENNPSDSLTHYWSAVDATKHFMKVGNKFKDSFDAIPAYNV